MAPVDISGDGGLLKEILVHGVGEDTPQKNDDVYVHYVGTLESDGSKFDSSRDRNSPFNFKLGVGSVIKGWDLGVATMKKGEKSMFTIRSDYAYGDAGSPPKIPAKATLKFEVELLRWNEREVAGTAGGVTVKIIEEGSGWQHPGLNDEVKVVYTATLLGEEGKVVENVSEPVVVELGKGKLASGLELALTKELKLNSKALVTCTPPFCSLPSPPSSIQYSIHLLDWNTKQQLNSSTTLKCLGQNSKYQKAENGCLVEVEVEGKWEKEKEKEVVFQENKIFCVTVGAGEVFESVDFALPNVKEGQKAEIVVQPGHITDIPNLPQDATVTFTILVKSIKSSYQMSTQEKVEACAKIREVGNALFKAGKMELALAKYNAAFKLVEFVSDVGGVGGSDDDDGDDDDADDGDDAQKMDLSADNDNNKNNNNNGDDAAKDNHKDQANAKQAKLLCHLNRAMVHKKQNNHPLCVQECTSALDLDPNNTKALFRRGCARIELQQLEEATGDLKRVLELDPSVTEAAKFIEIAAKRQRILDERDKKVFAKMLQGLGGGAETTSTAAAATTTKQKEPEHDNQAKDPLSVD